MYDEDTELRLYCLMRVDLEMPLGKMIGQGGHAFLGTLKMADPEDVETYFSNAQPKIVLKAKNLHVIERAAQECAICEIPHYVVTDAARTVFPEPTITCIGIGPVQKNQLPNYIRKLQLMA